MKVADYNSKLAMERSKFNEASNELKRNYDSSLKNREELHSNQIKSLKDKYSKERENISSNANKRINDAIETGQKIVKENQQDFNNRVENEKNNFRKESANTRAKYAREMNEAKRAFDETKEFNQKYFGDKEETLKNRLNSHIDTQAKQFESDINNYSDKASKEINEMRAQAKVDKQNLVKEFANEKQKLTDFSDFAGKSAKMRDRFTNLKADMSSKHQAQLEELKNQQDQRVSDIKDAFGKQQDKLEKSSIAFGDRANQKTSEAINNNKDIFSRKFNDYKKDKEGEISNLRKDHLQAKNNLKASYDRSLEESDKLHAGKMENKVQNLERRIASQQNSFQNDISKMSDTADAKFTKQRSDSQREKKDIIEKHNTQMKSVISRAADEQGKINTKRTEELNNVRKSAELEKKFIKENMNSIKDGALSQKEAQLQAAKENFSNVMQLNQEKNQLESQKSEYDHKKLVKQMQTDFANNLHSMKRESNSILNSGNRGDEAKLKNERLTKKFENQIGSLNNKIKDMSYQQQADKDLSLKTFQANMKDQANEFQEVIDKREHELSKQNQDLFEKSRGEKNELTGKFKRIIQNNQLNSDIALSAERNALKKKLNNQRDFYSNVMDQISSKNKDAIESIKEDLQSDKTKFIEGSRKSMHETMANMRESFANKNMSTNNMYDLKIQDLQKKMDRTIEQYESRITKIQETQSKKLDEIAENADIARKISMQNNKRADDLQKADYRQKLLEAQAKFDEKMSKVKKYNDVHIAKLTSRYEEQISRMARDHSKDMKIKLGIAEGNYERLAKQSELERDALRNQYEIKMDKIKMDNMYQKESKVDA